MIGDAGVGKTALITRYLEGRFSEEYTETTEHYLRHTEPINTAEVQMDIWDIGGNPENRLNQEKVLLNIL